MPQADAKAIPEVIRVEELSLTPTSYNTQESRACTSPGQYSRADLVGEEVGKPALMLCASDGYFHYSNVIWPSANMGRRDTYSLPIPYTHQFPRQMVQLALRL